MNSMTKFILRYGTFGMFACAMALAALAAGQVCAAEKNKKAESKEKFAVSQKMTIAYRRVPLERVLEYISRSSKSINIKINVDDEQELDELKRTLVTVELTNVTWRTAVDYIATKYKFVANYDKEADGVVLLERPPRITLNVRNAEIGNVIKLIAAEARANIIIGAEVTGQISFDIHDVPWKDALDSILKSSGFIKVEDTSGIIRITTPEMVQAQHEIRAVALKYMQPAGTHYLPKVESSYVKRGSTGGEASDAATSLMGVLNEIKSPEGSVSYEQRTNMIIIKDTSTRIEEMLAIIKQIDREPMQVKINARIISITGDDGKTIGMNWGQGLIGSVSGSSAKVSFPFSEGFRELDDVNILTPSFRAPEGPVPVTNAGDYPWESAPKADDPFETYTLGTLDFTALQATLQMVKNSTSAKLVQAPEIVALDNQEATIHIGNIIRYAEFYVNTTDGGSQSGYREVRPPVVDGVQLIVVPHVCGTDDKVLLEVVPKTEEFIQWDVFGEGTSSELRLPRTSSKVVVTKMLLKNRETGIIGGLMKDKVTNSESAVPFFSDIPVLGRAFKSNTSAQSKENVLIFITPTIIGPRSEDNFREDLDSMRDMAENFGEVGGLDLPDDDE